MQMKEQFLYTVSGNLIKQCVSET